LWAASAFINSLHFLFLGTASPAVITAITGARFLLAGRDGGSWRFYFFIAAQLSAGYLTFSSPLSLLPLFASLIGTVAVFFFSNANMRISMGICSLIWIAHNYLAGSPVAVVTEIIFLGSNFVGFQRMKKRWRAIEGASQKSN